MKERYKIATSSPAKYRAGSVGSGDPTPQPFGFPKDGGVVSPAEMSGFFLPGAAGHHRFADTPNAAVTLPPPPRPMVGDFFCLLTLILRVIACYDRRQRSLPHHGVVTRDGWRSQTRFGSGTSIPNEFGIATPDATKNANQPNHFKPYMDSGSCPE